MLGVSREHVMLCFREGVSKNRQALWFRGRGASEGCGVWFLAVRPSAGDGGDGAAPEVSARGVLGMEQRRRPERDGARLESR